MTVCPRTREIRLETYAIIKAHFLLLGLSEEQVETIPCWWAIGLSPLNTNPELNMINNFDKIWGALGIIPQQLVDWLHKNAKNTKDIPATIGEIHIAILQCMLQFWNKRCRHTNWKQRPPDRGIE